MNFSASKNHSYCLFCYNIVSEGSPENFKVNAKLQQRFFALIKRQMLNNIRGNCGVISNREVRWCRKAFNDLSSHLKFGDKHKNIHFCKECELATQQFCERYDQIELLKLQLDSEITNLCSVMRSADKLYLAKDLQGSHNLFNNSSDGLGLKKIRKTLKQGFKAYHKIQKTKSFPRVELTSIVDDNKEQDFVPKLYECIQIEDSCTEKEPSEKNCGTTKDFEDKITELDINEEYSTSTIKQDEIVSVDELLSSKPPTLIPEQEREISLIEKLVSAPSKQVPVQNKDHLHHSSYSSIKPSLPFKCSSCSYEVNTKFNLFKHNIIHHPGEYFISMKLKGLSKDQYKSYVIYLLTKIVNDSEKIDSKLECSVCKSKLKGRNALKYHYILKHRTNLEDKLVEMQKSNSVPYKFCSFSKRPVICKTKRDHICTLCPKMYQNSLNLKRHQCTNHPEIFFEACQNSSLNDSMFKVYTARVLEQSYVSTNGTKLFWASNIRLKCRHCNKKLRNSGDMKTHLINNHYEKISKKLKDSLGDVNSSNLVTFKQIGRIWSKNKNRSRGLLKAKPIDRFHTCPVCNKTFQKSYRLNFHESFLHPELFFESSNILWAGQNSNYFRKFVDRNLIEEVNNMFTKSVKMVGNREHETFKCTICSKVSHDLKFAKSHLILRHRKIIAGKLEHLQNSVNSREEFEKDLGTTWQTKINSNRNSSPFSSFSTSPGQNICKVCSKTYSRRPRLNQHVAFHHPTLFFEWVKNPSLTIDQFSDCVQELLSNKLANFERSMDMIHGTMKWQCSICPRRVLGPKQDIKSHVLMCHANVLGEELKQAQQSIEYKLNID